MIFAACCGDGLESSIFGDGEIDVITEHRGSIRNMAEDALGAVP